MIAVARCASELLASERDRWVLWLPVLVGSGAGLYFALDREPPPWLGAFVLALMGLLAMGAWRGGARWPLLPVAALAALAVTAGFAVAQAQALLLATPMLAGPVGPVTLEGEVAAAESFPDGQRLTLVQAGIAGGTVEPMPERVRLRLRGSQPLVRPGDQVRLRAMLMSPPPPAVPGGYDFQRQAYFDGLGAVGYSVGKAVVREPEGGGGIAGGGLGLAFARVRFAVGEQVREHLRGATAAVALALLTGEQQAIPNATMQAIRDSGLAHLLSISGLHIGLVAGMVFIVVRGVLALVPALALRLPTKKLAAVVSVLAAGSYTLLADAPVPSQRSFLMVAIVLLAVLVDRQGISIRLVAFSALVILLTQPASMLGPSFQMSFAAVVALIAVYEVIEEGRRPPSQPRRPLRQMLLYVGGVVLSTLVASVATTPFAVYHFSRFQVWGIAANMLAVPVTGFWIMPWAVVAMLLMPFGWEGLGLRPMGWGVDVVIEIARQVAAWPAAVVLLPPLPTAGLVLFTFGGAWLCLWRQRWRLLGLFAIAAGAASLLPVRAPDVLVAADGRLLAVRGGGDDLAFSARNSARSTREAWLRRSALPAAGSFWPERGLAAGGRLRCDSLGCVYRVHGRTVAFPASPRRCWTIAASLTW
ncbi:MAG: ComEC/Rec2 family competence protein [Rhodospirillales bacterium]